MCVLYVVGTAENQYFILMQSSLNQKKNKQAQFDVIGFLKVDEAHAETV